MGPRTKMFFGGLLVVLFASLSTLTLKSFFSQDSVTRIMDPDTFPAVTIASVNCNSLNMSSVGSFNHKLKLYGITSLKSDIIFVLDIRMSNNANVSCIDSVKTTFRTNPYGGYDFFYNSTQNKRGVGILLKKSACFSVLEEKREVPSKRVMSSPFLHKTISFS